MSGDQAGEAVREKARQVLAGALEIDVSQVPDDASIETLEAWDSLAHLRLVQGLEEAVGGQLSAENIISLEALDDVAAILGETPEN
jgi:acyl carrier protein